MDTNLKNSNEGYIEIIEDKKTKIDFYSKKHKASYVVIVFISLITIALGSCFLINNHHNYNDNHLDSTFSRYCYTLVDAKLNLQNEAHIKEFYETSYDKAVRDSTADVLDTYTYPINPDTPYDQTNQATSYEFSYNTDSVQMQEDETATKTYSREYTDNKIQERINDLDALNSDLDSSINFVYVIVDTETNIISTNIDKNPNVTTHVKAKTNSLEYTYTDASGAVSLFNNSVDILKLQKNYVSFTNGKANEDLYNSYTYDIEKLIKDTETSKYNIYCAIIEPISLDANGVADTFYVQNKQHQEIVPIYKTVIALIAVMSVIFLIALAFLTLFVGRNEKYGKVQLWKIDQLPFEIHTLLILFMALLSLDLLNNIFNYFVALIVFAFDIFIGLNYYCSFFRQVKAKTLFKKTLTYAILKKIKSFLLDIIMLCKSSQKYPFIIFISVVFILCALNALWYLFLLVEYSGAFILILGTVLLNLIFVAWIVSVFISINKVKVATKEISSGNVDYKIQNHRMTGTLKSLSEDITNIQSGLTTAVAEAIKGERLKTELITNVSHDLKTPLTSIINYVDLLKKEDLKNEKAIGYINILEEKSARLKQLIEDLVEASKASSGTISVAFEKVDLHQLILQACGEYGEKISKSNLDIKINSSGNGTLIAADGKHMWRVIENLLSNITKYAQPNSRVYIDITQNAHYGLLTIKNISRDSLDITPEELTQRFVRGDSSRTTEGSGLGLSIAQSLTHLQRGNFNVFIDGDLFKVVVEIPLWL